MVVGGLIAGGAGLLGGILDKNALDDANAANAARLAQILAEFGKLGDRNTDTGFGRQRQLLDKAEGLQRRNIGLAQEGTQRSLGELSKLGSEGTRAILQQGDRARADLDVSLGGRGLSNSSARTAGRSSITDLTQEQLGSLFANLGGARSGVIERGTGREMGATGDLSRFLQGRSASELGLLTRRLAVIEGVNDTPGPSTLSALGGGQGLAALGGLFS